MAMRRHACPHLPRVWALLLSLSCLGLFVAESSAWQRNSTNPLVKQCWERYQSRLATPPSLLSYDMTARSDFPKVYIRDIILLNELAAIATQDQSVNRMQEYERVYSQFASRTKCLAWDSVVKQWMTPDEITALSHKCLCSSVRNSLVRGVQVAYPCDLEGAPHGSLSDVYLTHGHRIITILRIRIGLLGNESILRQYDTMVRQCFTKFFQQVSTRMDKRKETSSGSTSFTAAVREETPPHSWLMLCLITLGTIALYIYQCRQRIQPHGRMDHPPATPPAPAAAEGGPRTAANEIAHPD